MNEIGNEQTEIIKSEDVMEFSLYRKAIYGLNIFRVNDVTVALDEDPLIVFLRDLTKKGFCSVHTGDLSNFAASPQELFGYWMNNHLLSQTTLFESYFFNIGNNNVYPSVIFPTINENFWEKKTINEDNALEQILLWRAMAVYANDKYPEFDKVEDLIQKNSSHENWIREITKIYKLLLLPDNNYVYIYAQEKQNFQLLNEPLKAATTIVKQNRWFKKNESSLIWNEDKVNCLTL